MALNTPVNAEQVAALRVAMQTIEQIETALDDHRQFVYSLAMEEKYLAIARAMALQRAMVHADSARTNIHRLCVALEIGLDTPTPAEGGEGNE